jgi:cation diffusion facilitator family transporter
MRFKDPAERITAVSIVVTTVMGTIESLAGFTFGSVAFVAAGVDALTDTVTSLGVILGLRVSKRPPDAEHHYGHLQAETLASLFLAVVLFIAGIRVAYSAAERLYSGAAVQTTFEIFLIGILAISVFWTLANKKIRTGKKTGNLSVVADGYHTLSDTVSALAVFVGLIFVRQGFPKADPIIALGISVLITWWSLRIGRDAFNILMGASPGPEVMSDIRNICRSVPGVLDCHRARARRVGSRILADIHVLVDPKMSIGDAHEIATQVERRLKAKVKGLSSVVVHVEPHSKRKSRG